MDLIYFILVAPIAIVGSFCFYKLSQCNKDWANLPEAKPYQFEKDQFIDSFNEKILHQRKQIKKLYKGKIK
jgi:hypothetical protein